jgi:hypothetical protein
VPVPPTPNADPKAPVETGVPDDPKEARFKRLGEETGASTKKKDEEEPAAAAASEGPAEKEPAASVAEPAPALPAAARSAARTDARPSTGKKPRTAIMAGAAVAVFAVVGVGALALRGGSQPDSNGSELSTQASPDTAATAAALGTPGAPGDANGVAADTSENVVAAQQGSDQGNTAQALRSEKAKTAAAEAQLAAIKKAQAKAALAQATPGVPPVPASKADRKAAAAADAASSSGGGVSPAKLGQFNSIVDDGRSMAKQAMRSSNKQNVQLAKNYDQYLKTLKDSMRGIRSDKEADKLIKQATQTRAYIQYLLRQQ